MAFRSEGILVVSAVLAGLPLTGWLFTRSFSLPYPPPSELKPVADDAVEDVALLSLGMRRAAADLGFVRLLQYYGTPEGDADDSFEYLLPGKPHHHAHEGGVYPELYGRAREIVDLDPYFEHAAMYASGALAFNLNRPQEAIELLERVRVRDRHNWHYDALLAAIGYQKAQDPGRVADSLMPVALDPDSPAMVKQVTAFLLKRIGRKVEAVNVYRLLLDTTKDEGYQRTARKNIIELTGREPGRAN